MVGSSSFLQTWNRMPCFSPNQSGTCSRILYFLNVIYCHTKTEYSRLRRLVAGFPPRRPGFESRWSHVGFVVDKVALGQVFSEYFGFSCQLSFHRLLHTHHLSSGAGTIVQLVADVPSGLSLTPSQETRRNILYQKAWWWYLWCYAE
jgi:hypothetical protein